MSAAPSSALPGYYRLHAPIYDLTRWSFLFGRKELIDALARQPAERILEIGCGTGYNLKRMADRFPRAQLVGADLSADMLDRARRNLATHAGRVRFHHGDFAELDVGAGFDLIVLAYTLSMTHPHTETLLRRAVALLAPGGRLAVVDFHDSPWPLFKRWMAVNHVRMEGELPELFSRVGLIGEPKVARAYGGVWRYLCYVGQRAAPGAGASSVGASTVDVDAVRHPA